MKKYTYSITFLNYKFKITNAIIEAQTKQEAISKLQQKFDVYSIRKVQES